MSRHNLVLLAVVLLITGCAPRPPATDYARTPSYALQDISDSKLARAYSSAIDSHPGESGFHLLPSGPEALMMRIALIEASQRSLDLQYFSTQDDTTGKLLLEALYRAANRGVRVRMLLDDWNLDDFEVGAAALNANPHIEIRVFNPYATRDQSVFERIGNVFSYLHQFNRHMHNKALIVDNEAAIMGGRNLGDEYFEAGDNIHFRDIDIFTVGPVTRRISSNFDRYWNSDESFPLSALNLPPPNPALLDHLHADMRQHWDRMMHSPIGRWLKSMPLPHKAKKGEAPLIWAHAELVADSPGKVDHPDENVTSAPGTRLAELTSRAHHEFIIFTPYFVPLDDGVQWLSALVKRGIKVRVVTNSLASTDMVPAEAGYGHYRQALVKAGVDLYEIKSNLPEPPLKSMFKPSSQNGLHAKVYMIDRRDLVIGSFNLDPRSIKLNTEQVLVIHSPWLCAPVARLFDHLTQLDTSYHIILTRDVPPSQRENLHGTLAWMTEENGRIVYYDFNPHAGFWRSVTDALFSLLPIDNQL